jgi:hypothetical protein
MSRKRQPLEALLETEIRKGLRRTDLEPVERIRLIEAGTKLVTVKHKVESSDAGTAGSFFAK